MILLIWAIAISFILVIAYNMPAHYEPSDLHPLDEHEENIS